MSIIAYTGLPGSGKSYSAVHNVIIPALKKDRIVYHNLRLNVDELMHVSGGLGRLVSFDKVGDEGALAAANAMIENCPPGAVVVIDECWQYYGAGVKTGVLPRQHVAFFKEHRHSVEAAPPADRADNPFACEILVIDQELSSGLAKFVRDLIEQTYIHSKLSKGITLKGFAARLARWLGRPVQSFGSYRVDVYDRAQNIDRPQQTKLVRKKFGRYSPAIFKCYISHTANQDAEFGTGVMESIADDSGKFWKSWQFRASALALVMLPALFYWSASAWDGMNPASSHESDGTADRESSRSNVALKPRTDQRAGQSNARTAPAPAKPSKPTLSTTWRFAGTMTYGGSVRVVLASANGGRVITEEHCERDSVGEWSCMLDGQRITSYSGPKPSLYQSALSTGSAAPSAATP